MNDTISVNLSREDVERLKNTYGDQLYEKIQTITKTYNQKIVRQAKEIIRNESKIDTGRLRNSVKESVKIYSSRGNIVGEVYSATEYARFIHEGAKHQGSRLIPHFVSFKTAPSIKAWAIKHKIINNVNGKWYYSDKYNKKHLISNLDKSGLRVQTPAIKFLEIPFNKYKSKYVEELERLVTNI